MSQGYDRSETKRRSNSQHSTEGAAGILNQFDQLLMKSDTSDNEAASHALFVQDLSRLRVLRDELADTAWMFDSACKPGSWVSFKSKT